MARDRNVGRRAAGGRQHLVKVAAVRAAGGAAFCVTEVICPLAGKDLAAASQAIQIGEKGRTTTARAAG